MNNRSNQYSLLLLAGGKSSRMGSNKAELIYEGKTFADLLTEKAEKLGICEIFVSGFAYRAAETENAEKGIFDKSNNTYDQLAIKTGTDISKATEKGIKTRRHIHVVWDQYTDRGPLGGIHACMKAMKTPFCLVLPVDAPKLPQNILEELIRRHETCRAGLTGEKEIPFLWEHDDRKEPLIAIYPVEMADSIGELIREKSAPVFRMLDRWGYECYRLEMDQPQVINVNTPELYKELLENI